MDGKEDAMNGKHEIWVWDEDSGWFLEYATDDDLAAEVVAGWCVGVDLMYVWIRESP